MSAIASLGKLERLSMNDSKLGNDEIAQLANHPSIAYLCIESSLITDESLVHFDSMPCLKRVDAGSSTVGLQKFAGKRYRVYVRHAGLQK
jgi:hypothetical protein